MVLVVLGDVDSCLAWFDAGLDFGDVIAVFREFCWVW